MPDQIPWPSGFRNRGDGNLEARNAHGQLEWIIGVRVKIPSQQEINRVRLD